MQHAGRIEQKGQKFVYHAVLTTVQQSWCLSGVRSVRSGARQ